MAGPTGMEGKKAKVTGRGTRSKSPRKSSGFPTTLVILACAVVAIVAVIKFSPGSGQNTSGGNTASNETIQMTDLNATVSDGTIAVPVATVKEKRLVAFTYKGATEIPLLAYVAPSGEIVTAVSVCEPCSSERFFIKGNRIICSSCGTEWDLESLKGFAGGCTKYPPDKLDNTIAGEVIRIDEKSVAGWKSRI